MSTADVIKVAIAVAWWSFAWSFVWSGAVFWAGYHMGRRNKS